MKKAKTTKRALLSGVLALLMCVSSFVGTTFAWFTDSVTSANNVITAGNLDLEVEYTLDGETWNDLDGAKDLFSKGLWEPGHTEVVALKVTNAGSLALKYVAGMNVTKETIGKTKDGKDIKLSDILTVSTITQADNDWGDMAVAAAFMSENMLKYQNTATFADTSILGSGNILAAAESHLVFVKVDMDETVGNEANHDGKNVPTIEFGIEVVATQYTAENDSFGNDYDAEAWADAMLVANEEELQYAMDHCKDVILGADITLTKYLNIANAGEIKIDLNGKKLARNGGTMLYINNAEAVVDIYDYSVVDTGVIDATTDEVKASQAIYVNAGVVNIYSGNFKASTECVYAMGTGKANIYGGSFMGSESFTLNKKDADRATTEINVYGGEFLNFNPANNAAENAGTNFCADGYGANIVYKSNGEIWYAADKLGTAGQGVVVEKDVTLNVTEDIVTDKVGVENNGGTVTVKDTTINAGNPTNYSNITTGSTATTVYENVNITAECGGIAVSNGAKVEFKSGSVKIGPTGNGGRYSFYLSGEGSTLTINDGNFSFTTTNNVKLAYIYAGAGTTVYINGGTFGKPATRSSYKAGILGEGTVIIKGGTFGFDPSAWVADGYEAVKSGTTWTVSAIGG